MCLCVCLGSVLCACCERWTERCQAAAWKPGKCEKKTSGLSGGERESNTCSHELDVQEATGIGSSILDAGLRMDGLPGLD